MMHTTLQGRIEKVLEHNIVSVEEISAITGGAKRAVILELKQMKKMGRVKKLGKDQWAKEDVTG